MASPPRLLRAAPAGELGLVGHPDLPAAEGKHGAAGRKRLGTAHGPLLSPLSLFQRGRLGATGSNDASARTLPSIAGFCC